MRMLTKLKKQLLPFFTDDCAVIDLPLRMLVSLVIGLISLTVILSFVFQPSLFEQELIVSIHPSIAVINQTNPETHFLITVSDEQAHLISQAQVIVHADTFIKYNMTDNNGETTIKVNTTTQTDQYETFADVKVKASGYQSFFGKDLIKIIYQ